VRSLGRLVHAFAGGRLILIGWPKMLLYTGNETSEDVDVCFC